jgi:hypothetical protein
MIVIHTNLHRWEGLGFLQPFGLALTGRAEEPLWGIRFGQAVELTQANLSEQDIVLSHDGNFIDVLTRELDWAPAAAVYLVLHQKKDLLAFQRIAARYPAKPALFSFAPAGQGPAVAFIQRIAEHWGAADPTAYQAALASFAQALEDGALHQLAEHILQGSLLPDACAWAGKHIRLAPYLWQRLFTRVPELPELLQSYHAAPDSAAQMAYFQQIHACLKKSLG